MVRLMNNVRLRRRTLCLSCSLRRWPVGFAFIDCDVRIVRINDALAAITGIPGEQHAGRPIVQVIPELWPELEPAYSQMVETRRASAQPRNGGRGTR